MSDSPKGPQTSQTKGTPDNWKEILLSATPEELAAAVSDLQVRRFPWPLLLSAIFIGVAIAFMMAPGRRERLAEKLPPFLAVDAAVLEAKVERLEGRVKALSTSPQKLSEDAAAQRIAETQSLLDDTRKRLGGIEEVILSDPAKALALNRMHDRIERLQEAQETINKRIQLIEERIWAGFIALCASLITAVAYLFRELRLAATTRAKVAKALD